MMQGISSNYLYFKEIITHVFIPENSSASIMPHIANGVPAKPNAFV